MPGDIVILPAKLKIPIPHNVVTFQIFLNDLLFRSVQMREQAYLPDSTE